jgi:hypothetical protein
MSASYSSANVLGDAATAFADDATNGMFPDE